MGSCRRPCGSRKGIPMTSDADLHGPSRQDRDIRKSCAAHDHGSAGGHSRHHREAEARATPESAIYTCPMHPQIRQVGPGSCPICGMTLEPVFATAAAGPSHELHDMTRRFWIGLVLAIPVVALEMGGHLTGLRHYLGQQPSNWLQLLFATPVVLWAGWPFFAKALQSLVSRNRLSAGAGASRGSSGRVRIRASYPAPRARPDRGQCGDSRTATGRATGSSRPRPAGPGGRSAALTAWPCR